MTDTQVMAALEVEQADRDFAESISHMLEYPHVDIPKIAALVASYRRAHSSPVSGEEGKVGRCDIESNLTGCLHPEEHQGRCGYSSPVAGESDLCEHCGEYAHDCGGHPIVDSGDAELRKALEKITTRLSAHPDDTPEDDRRGRHYAYSIATNALATLATHPSVPAQQGWLPIETAPKTGEPVLIWKPDERMVGEYMMVAYWSDDHLVGEPGWIPVGGVHKQGYTSSVTGTDQGYPTHWMPLPTTPPAQDQKGEDCRG